MGHSAQQIMLVAVILIAAHASIVPTLYVCFRPTWGRLARDFPPQPPRPDAVSRGGQGLRFNGWMGCNGCVTITADEDYLHLSVWRCFAWLGAPPMSIPWDEIRVTRPARERYGNGTAVIRGVRVDAPAWCLSLAPPADPPADAA